MQVIKGVGGLKHEQWRSFSNEHKQNDTVVNFIDGDLIEAFLDLKRERMEEVPTPPYLSERQSSKSASGKNEILILSLE